MSVDDLGSWGIFDRMLVHFFLENNPNLSCMTNLLSCRLVANHRHRVKSRRSMHLLLHKTKLKLVKLIFDCEVEVY